MKAAKLIKIIDEKTGKHSFKRGSIKTVNRADFARKESGLQNYKQFLEKVTRVDLSKLNKKFTI